MPEAASPGLVAWVDAYVETARAPEHVAQFVALVDERIVAGIPEIAHDAALTEDLHQSTRSQWIAFLDGLVPDGFEFTLTPQAVGLAQSLVRRGLDLTVLLSVYRLASQGLWDFFTAFVATLGPDDPPRDEVLVYLFGLSSAWVEEMTGRLIDVFYSERGQFFDGAAARQRELVDSILAGERVDQGEAARALGHPVQRAQVCLILWVAEADAHTLEVLRDAALGAADRVGAPPPLMIVAGSRELWCWIALPERADEWPTTMGVPASVNAAVGTPSPGVTGMRISYEEARAAQALVESGHAPHPLTRYADVELLCLMGGRSPSADRAVRRVLGGLIGADPALAVLRDTVRVYLRNGMSVDATAATLVVHRNTVRYRLGRAEQFLGRSIGDHIAELELMLQYLAWFEVHD